MAQSLFSQESENMVFGTGASTAGLGGGPTPRAKQFGQPGSSVTRKILGDVSNTNKRVLKQSKPPLFSIAVDGAEVKSHKKKEKKESVPIFAGGAPGDDDLSILKLSKELDDCIAQYSRPACDLFKLNFEAVSDEKLLADERRSPDATVWPAPPSRDCELPTFLDCFVDLKEEDLEF